MSVITFDTLGYSKRLEAAGFTRQQAETLADESVKLIEDNLATRNDLFSLEQRLTIRLGTMIFASAGFQVALVGVLIALLK